MYLWFHDMTQACYENVNYIDSQGLEAQCC